MIYIQFVNRLSWNKSKTLAGKKSMLKHEEGTEMGVFAPELEN